MKFKCSCGYISWNANCLGLLKELIKSKGGKLEYDYENGGMKGKCPECNREIKLGEDLELI
jgi:hypothetical protein